MHASSEELPEAESEFAKAGLTPVPARMVKHPRIGEILLVHARDGIIDPQTRRISEENYRPIGRLYASRHCTTRQRFDLPGHA